MRSYRDEVDWQGVMSEAVGDSEGSRRKLRSELYRRKLEAFHKGGWKVHNPKDEYDGGFYTGLLCEYMEAVVSGEITRLGVFIPPRSGKSKLVSVSLPCWVWTKLPEWKWIFSSYSGSLSTGFSLDRRRLIRSPWYQGHFGGEWELTEDRDTKTHFENTRGGEMFATSMLGTVTGEGADCIVFDDPQNPKIAASRAEREKMDEAFNKTYPSRLDNQKTGRMIGIMQRLGVKDLGARMIELGWTIVELEGVAQATRTYSFPRSGREYTFEEGECLFPNRCGPEEHKRLKAQMGAVEYSAQYLQKPIPEEGVMFNRAWFRLEDEAPAMAEVVRYWDKASTQGAGCYTVGAKVGRDLQGRYWVLDIVRERLAPGPREDLILRTARSDGPKVKVYVEREPGSAGMDSASATVRNLAGFEAFMDIVTGDKVSRALPFCAQAQAGNVIVLRRHWTECYLDEMHEFPDGAFLDQADASAGGFNKVASATGGGDFAIEEAAPARHDWLSKDPIPDTIADWEAPDAGLAW